MEAVKVERCKDEKPLLTAEMIKEFVESAEKNWLPKEYEKENEK